MKKLRWKRIWTQRMPFQRMHVCEWCFHFIHIEHFPLKLTSSLSFPSISFSYNMIVRMSEWGEETKTKSKAIQRICYRIFAKLNITIRFTSHSIRTLWRKMCMNSTKTLQFDLFVQDLFAFGFVGAFHVWAIPVNTTEWDGWVCQCMKW